MRRLVVALLLVAGCSTEPLVTPSTFVLRSIGGDTLPTVIGNPGTQLIVADTVRLIFNGPGVPLSLADHYSWRLQDSVYSISVHSQVELHGEQLTFVPVQCPMGALCIETHPSGTLRGDTLTISYASGIGLRTKTYVRR